MKIIKGQIMILNLDRFNVRYLSNGDKYGLKDNLIADRPMVEFYDSKYPHTQYGQFVSRYYVSTILKQDDSGGEYANGLCLNGGVPAWHVSPNDMKLVVSFLHSM
jgi:hypothetical protein